MNTATATKIVGGLSRTTKMPCPSYGLPTHACIRGKKLAQVSGTVCKTCYADCRGNYRFPNVQAAQELKLSSLRDPLWVEAMSTLLYFEDHMRWHDSGDLQGKWHLNKIIEVAKNTPSTLHWLPTHEPKMVENVILPENLRLRISADLIDQPAQTVGFITSTVHTGDPLGGWECPAPSQGGKCGSCRACWDRTVDNVSYRKH